MIKQLWSVIIVEFMCGFMVGFATCLFIFARKKADDVVITRVDQNSKTVNNPGVFHEGDRIEIMK